MPIANSDYVPDPFPGISAGADTTGAPGSEGITATATAGPVVGSPVVSAPYGSSQLPANRPTLAVTSGDTSGFSDDNPAHSSAIMPGPAGDYASTGAGDGHADAWARHSWQQSAGGA